MSGMFGSKWTNPYGEWSDDNPTIAIWGAALRGLTMEQVNLGLDSIANSGLKFVPVAPEFKEYCTGPKQHWEHARIDRATEEFDENQKRLEHCKVNREVGNKAISKIHEMLEKDNDDS
jgi:hypothetical protein